jgi:hypothetical protein
MVMDTNVIQFENSKEVLVGNIDSNIIVASSAAIALKGK